jgi:hypothetical protein
MRAVLVHAFDEKAAAFYARYGFKPASTEPLMLMVHWRPCVEQWTEPRRG